MPKKKLRIAVLMGGPSAEREISLITGQAIYKNLDRKKYHVTAVEMTPDSRFFIPDQKKYLDLQNKDRKLFDLIFIALHGSPGEDGTVQGMLEALGIPYTGPGVLSSALAMDKEKTAEIYRVHNILTPDFIAFGPKEWGGERSAILKHVKKYLGLPVVIKPTNQGSAVGTAIVKTEKKLISKVSRIIKQFPRLMIQQFIKGQEATCGVLEKNDQAFPLPPTRIIANAGEFYDYKSKYAPGGSTHICPADFSSSVNKKIQTLALQAHHALGCRGMSRTDIFVADTGKLWVIETNTIPGMTPTSLLPEAASKAGISFPKMLDMIIESSLQK
ncbi:MAG: D-alanine--D-alanine ligase [Candidatus Magasanikbacteria bacterium]|nr:D-alanine--D-alanine ligase [Candidatus Magasanikbacteria bacterium]